MSVTGLTAASSARQDVLTEQDFYSQYAWCLNPVLTVRDLFHRLNQELKRHESILPPWQDEECRINLYLFVCAVACTVDDYLLPQGRVLPLLGRRVPRIRTMTGSLHRALARARAGNRKILAWRKEWQACVDLACTLLPFNPEERDRAVSGLKAEVARLTAESSLPRALLAARMQLVSGYRNQDLTHHDVVDMARKFADGHDDPQRGLAVIGLRSAGAYFAPIVKSYLAQHGWQDISWMSFRPKAGFAEWEHSQVRAIARSGRPVVIVDDHPDTGHTLRLALEMLEAAGVQLRNITVLVPGHPAQRDPQNLCGGKPVKLVLVEFDESFKVRWLDSESARRVVGEYLRDANHKAVRAHEASDTASLNASFRADMTAGFQTRIKRVFDIGGDEGERLGRVIGKGVGWGWLGYHAYLAGRSLEGLVPRVLGLRSGVLFSEFVKTEGQGSKRPGAAMVADYLGRRYRTLALDCDPYLGMDQVDSAWQLMTAQLRAVYGRQACRFKAGALRRGLEQYLPPVPVVTDGSMLAAEWLTDGERWYKTDYEHRGFGNPSLGAVDPAHDLAAAIFELGTSHDFDGGELEAAYMRETGDVAVGERVVLHKLLYGKVVEAAALHRLSRGASPAEAAFWNRRYLDARNYLIFTMNRFCGGRVDRSAGRSWTDRLLFLDLDGVLDSEILGFPHTTAAGIEALSLLLRDGYSVALNTGRSVAHVRDYCRHYGFSGGIGEFGSVFVDAVNGRETALIDPSAQEQLRECRREIESLDGIFLDDTYEYLLRAYRFRDRGTAGLAREDLLKISGRYDKLRLISRDADTYILAASADKGSALQKVCATLGLPPNGAACIGDSHHDLPMMKMAGRAYAPQNCSAAVEVFARSGGCRLVGSPAQRGLLTVARELTRGAHTRPAPAREKHLLDHLLIVADRSPARQLASILMWRYL